MSTAPPPVPSKSAERRAQQSRSGAFVAGAGELGSTSTLPWPIRVVARLVQWLIALMLIAFAKAVEHTFKRQDKRHGGRRRRAGGADGALGLDDPAQDPYAHELTAADILAQKKAS